jgi:hypothetical protein
MSDRMSSGTSIISAFMRTPGGTPGGAGVKPFLECANVATRKV